MNIHKRLTRTDYWAYGLFWSWNLIFVAFMTFGFAPRLLPDLIQSVSEGLVPAIFLISGLILTAIPVVAAILGLTVLRRLPRQLFALGYVVEGPLMLLLAVRLFLIRESNPALTFILVIASLGMAAFLWHLLDPEIKRGGKWAGWFRLVGMTLILLVSLYASVWILFYALPLIVEFFKWLSNTILHFGQFLKDLWRALKEIFRQPGWVVFYLLGFILLLYTGTLFALTPIAVPILAVRAWLRSLRQQVQKSGWMLPVALVVVTLLISTGAFLITIQQPQSEAFAELKEPPANLDQARLLQERADSLKKGLLNAYLAPFRYISSLGEVRHVSELYKNVFRMPVGTALNVQNLYENVARPLLYDPVHRQTGTQRTDNAALTREPQEAAQLYQHFFDTTIVDGERQTIVNAVRSTWSGTQAEAAWQAVDEREVHLVSQDVNIQEHGDWADVELFEVYQNQTAERQEVVYYFNLPESAVITGVWLGNSPDRNERFAYLVAPRGAAQTVYREQVRRNIDPALVEQIGPRQYRLRVFPIQPKVVKFESDSTRHTTTDAPLLYMWLTYRAMADGSSWPMPHLAVNRNVYWDQETSRTVNGLKMDVDKKSWLPEAVPASQAIAPMIHRVDLPGGESVLAVPAIQIKLHGIAPDLRLAVVLDRSYSMEKHASQVTLALNQLQKIEEAGATVDIYQTASLYRGEAPTRVALSMVETRKIDYLGGQNPAELLVQFDELRQGRSYDAVLVLTDGTGYELGASTLKMPAPVAPIWMVHLDSDIPLGYDDQTLEAIQSSGGGVVGDLNSALTRLALSQTASNPGDRTVRAVLDGYQWSVLPTAQAQSEASGATLHSPDDGFAALAARRLILAEIQRQRGSLKDLSTLDSLHALAQQYSIVTPYSSMIVLVTEQQKQLLKKEEAKSDRFDREVEAVGETTPPAPPPLTGVPEPQEWLLIAIAVALLAWYAAKKRTVRT